MLKMTFLTFYRQTEMTLLQNVYHVTRIKVQILSLKACLTFNVSANMYKHFRYLKSLPYAAFHATAGRYWVLQVINSSIRNYPE